MRKFLAGFVALLLCAPLAWASPPGIPGQMRSASSRAAAQLRHEYYLQDFSRVLEDGRALLARYPQDLELRAWYVVEAAPEEASLGIGELGAIVKQMKQSAPNSPWTLLAGAAATGNLQEKLALCEKAVEESSSNSDLLVLATNVVMQATNWPADPETLRDFLTKHKGEYKRSPHGLAAEAQALSGLAEMETGAEARAAARAALKLADRALKSDPTNVAALLLKSQALVKRRGYQANYDLLKAAAQSSDGGTDSYALHLAYWKAVLALPGATAARKAQEIEADAGRMIAAVKPSTETVQVVLLEMDRIAPAVATALGDLLVKRYPHSAVEDVVLLDRATADEGVIGDAADAEIIGLEGFIDRPVHYDAEVLRQANSELVVAMTGQDHPDLNRLYRAELAAAGGRFGPPTGGIVKLADSKSHLLEIESLARAQLDAELTRLQVSVGEVPESRLESQVQFSLQYYAGGWLDALGWVEFQEGKLDAGFADLTAAAEMRPQDPQVAIHLGRAYESKGDDAKAGQLFADALSMPYYGEGDDPAIAALHELYVHTHGSAAGLDAYMQPILAKDAARREKAVLAERLNPEEPIQPFELTALDGKEVRSEGLRGKYLILNFWATW